MSPIVVVTQPSDGTTADAADVNSQINAILAVLNGHVDQDNLADGGVTNAKLAGGITIDKMASSALAGWAALSAPPNTVTYNGNRNYSLVFNSLDLTSLLSNGMRLKLTRTVTAPTQCTSLNGTTQYFSKSSPAGMTFTDAFTVSAWVKLTSYPSVQGPIASRYNGTSGWSFLIDSLGRIALVGYNAGAANNSSVTSSQSIPLNKWVHISAQLDMASFTATTTTSYIMIDGVNVSAAVARGGTNPTALIQAGNLEIGSQNAGAQTFPGKLAQVAIYNAKVTQATVTASISQGLIGTETSLISAYSFNNSINDLNANANNLTANGSAVATAADSPFAGGGNASTANTAGTTEFGEIFNISFSTNTTVVVQVPDGWAIPTSGGINAASYSTAAKPLGWPCLGNILAYALICNPFTTVNTTPTQVPGLSVTAYIPPGRKAKVRLYTPELSLAAGGALAFATIHDGTVGATTQLQAANLDNAAAVTIGAAVNPEATVVASGSKTYNAGLYSGNGARTAGLQASTTAPTLLLVELEPEA